MGLWFKPIYFDASADHGIRHVVKDGSSARPAGNSVISRYTNRRDVGNIVNMTKSSETLKGFWVCQPTGVYLEQKAQHKETRFTNPQDMPYLWKSESHLPSDERG